MGVLVSGLERAVLIRPRELTSRRAQSLQLEPVARASHCPKDIALLLVSGSPDQAHTMAALGNPPCLSL